MTEQTQKDPTSLITEMLVKHSELQEKVKCNEGAINTLHKQMVSANEQLSDVRKNIQEIVKQLSKPEDEINPAFSKRLDDLDEKLNIIGEKFAKIRVGFQPKR